MQSDWKTKILIIPRWWQTGVEISQKFQGLFEPQVLKKKEGPQGPKFPCSNIPYTSGIEMSQLLGPFGPLILTFCGPSPNFEGNWSEGPPYFDPRWQTI